MEMGERGMTFHFGVILQQCKSVKVFMLR